MIVAVRADSHDDEEQGCCSLSSISVFDSRMRVRRIVERTGEVVELYANNVSRPDTVAPAHDACGGQLRLRHPKIEARAHLERKVQIQRHAADREILTEPVAGLPKTHAVAPGDQSRAAHETSLLKSGGPDSSRREGHREPRHRQLSRPRHRQNARRSQTRHRRNFLADRPGQEEHLRRRAKEGFSSLQGIV